MKKAIALALAVLATSVVAASAQGSQKVAARVWPVSTAAGRSTSRSSPRSPAVPASSGTEQASWAKYAVKTLAPKYGLKVKLLLGDTPVEAGPAPALALAQKYIADKRVLAVLGPSTSGNAGATAKPFFAAGIAADLAVGDPHRPHVRDPR